MYDEGLKSTDSSWPERYFDPFKGANKLSKDWRQLRTSLVIGRVKNPTEFHNSKREESNQGTRKGKKTWTLSTISNMKLPPKNSHSSRNAETRVKKQPGLCEKWSNKGYPSSLAKPTEQEII